ncbi:MAG: hypothetical protein AAGA56_16285 [Myxococcota bacterium]
MAKVQFEPPADRQRPERWLLLCAGLAVVGLIFMQTAEPTEEPRAGAGTLTATATSAAAGEATARPRCREAGAAVGVRVEAEDDAATSLGAGGEAPTFLPFSVEVGRGAPRGTEPGFVVGVKRHRDGAPWAEVFLVDDRAEGGRLVPLARSRGDLGPPVVAASSQGWVAGVLEPHAAGFELRLVRASGDDELTWGASFEQGRDESLAVDIALGERGGIAVWDEVVEKGARAVVQLAGFDEGLGVSSEARVVSGDAEDADLPRAVSFDGGYWVTWISRSKGGAKRSGSGGGRYAAERIEPSRVRVLLLDRDGEVVGAPRAVTPIDGYVAAYDAAMVGAQLLVAWRDDDTPLGAHGGELSTISLSVSGEGEIQPVAKDDLGAGVPLVLGRWLVVPGRGRDQRMAPMDTTGVLVGLPQVEPALRGSQLLGQRGGTFLAARPAGRSSELHVVRCDPSLSPL